MKSKKNKKPVKSPEIIKPKVEYVISGSRGSYRAGFKIGVQTFYVCDERTKSEAKWFIKMLKIAFRNLSTGKLPK